MQHIALNVTSLMLQKIFDLGIFGVQSRKTNILSWVNYLKAERALGAAFFKGDGFT